MVMRAVSKGLTKAAQKLVGEIPPGMKKIPMSEAARKLKAVRKERAEKGTKPNADAAGIAFMKNKPPAGSGDQGKKRVLPRGDKGTGKLQQQFEALTKSAQRAEVAKGANSKYASVLRKLGKLKDSKKAGGKIMKRKAGGRLKDVPTTKTGLAKLPTNVRNKMGYAKSGGKVSDTKNATPKNKPTPPIGKGAVARGNRMSKMEADSAEAMNKKMGGGKVMKYKKGGMIYKKGGGVIKASDGDSFVAGCYTNKSIA